MRLPLFRMFTLMLGLALLAGCRKSAVDQALESDANGYVCAACQTKFYTDRDVFPDFCPKCKNARIDQVMGFVCAADKHVTLGSRSRGARRCEKCGGATSSVSIPKESELKAWGAMKCTRGQVCS